jgi:SAM-dependent methyltransferase
MTDSAHRWVGTVHGTLVHTRRTRVLSHSLASFISPDSRVLDIGCGDGVLAALLGDAVPHLQVQGVETAPRTNCAIECQSFDGRHLPFPDASFDVCLFVDVLHHTLDPLPLLRDACRVSSRFVLIKDHLAESSFDHWTLRFMDWFGNRPHGVVLPYAYLSQIQWDELFLNTGLKLARTEHSIPLYPPPFSWIFGRRLHFISLLQGLITPPPELR